MDIEFNKNLLTGIEEIDSQHEHLFETINKLSEDKTNNDNIWDVLLEIERYTCIHFEAEEIYMTKFDDPNTDKHMKAHAEFLETFSDFKAIFDKSGFSKKFVLDYQKFLLEWISTHYHNIDIEMAKYIKKKLGLI